MILNTAKISLKYTFSNCAQLKSCFWSYNFFLQVLCYSKEQPLNERMGKTSYLYAFFFKSRARWMIIAKKFIKPLLFRACHITKCDRFIVHRQMKDFIHMEKQSELRNLKYAWIAYSDTIFCLAMNWPSVKPQYRLQDAVCICVVIEIIFFFKTPKWSGCNQSRITRISKARIYSQWIVITSRL